jgi:ferredoxin
MRDDPTLTEQTDADPCTRATEVFDQQAAELARVFAAARIAQLEIERKYDPVIHDPWFANFSWEGFSKDELLLVPTVLAVESADRVAGEGMQSFSHLLSSGRPVEILLRVQPSRNPGARPGEGPFQSYRSELGYLLECFLSSLDATRTSLHLINTGLRTPSNLVRLNAWLVAGAAIEGRAHPFFRINPEAGDAFALRMRFDGNPQPEADWPIHPFRYCDENGTQVSADLAFTFADYALLIENLRAHFRVIPPGCDSESLVPMQEYLALDEAQACRLVPFVWGVDESATLHRLVVSRELAMACLDRLNYWRTLQELAGIRNRYVDVAVGRTRNEERRLAAQERERLLAEHAEALEAVRNSAAREAMQRLTDVLLGVDQPASMRLGSASAGTPLAPATKQPPAEQPAQAPVQSADEALSFDEPWIDTPLCTSCNDCLKINPLLFVYTEEKQALLGDLSTATFAQLVQAAELCPAKCIHPGKPLNPNEPDLDELIERAAPFNR